MKNLVFLNGSQIENEYGHFGYEDEPRDGLYLAFLRDLLVNGGLENSLLFTSDSVGSRRDLGSLRGVLQTANFQTGAEDQFSMLKVLQPNRPLMVTEFWSGWFDYWLADYHSVWNVEDFASTLEYILEQNSSVNFYMFIGGTNFGFLAGSQIITSYDYGAPLSEAGDYTEKYSRLVEIFSRYNPLQGVGEYCNPLQGVGEYCNPLQGVGEYCNPLQGVVDNPVAPPQREKAAYGAFPITEMLPFTSLVSQAPETLVSEDGPVNMEALNTNEGNGQSFGYVLYSTDVILQTPQSELIIRGHVRDMAQVLVDGALHTLPYEALNDASAFGFWDGRDKNLTLPGTGALSHVEILVENLGRINFGAAHNFVTKKGLWEGDILVDRQRVVNWTITPLEFKSDFVNGLTGWEEFTESVKVPTVYRSTVTLSTPLLDTFLDMRNWNKGVVFVNGFNIGRYWSLGPQRTLYVPAPLLVEGENQITVFEQYTAAGEVVFIDTPILS
ncbi:Glycoside hydrolase 35 catalytic domain [Trinorchestia longiramus]|nr:Glycoside hydrolase 35 catalytic domain [Trinorchestia longiramus]